jgi:hypothetical protein
MSVFWFVGEVDFGSWSATRPLRSQPDGMVCGSGNGSKMDARSVVSVFSFGSFMMISPFLLVLGVFVS